LTRHSPKPAVSFGGVYRIVDFTLSNCLNSNMRNIYVLVQYKSAELIRHLRDGWQMYFSPARGEYLEIIPPQYAGEEQTYRGTADAIYQNAYLIEQERPECVLILAGDHIYKMDYRRMLDFHRASNADLTVGAVEVPLDLGHQFGVIQVDASNRIIGFQEKPKEPSSIPTNPGFCFASMGIYVFSPSMLLNVLRQNASDKKTSHDFGKDIIHKLVASHRVLAFSFIDENKKGAKYWRDVGTLDAYYKANMDLIGVDPLLNLYDHDWPIKGAPIQAPPPKFVFSNQDRQGMALDSMISPGCVISGGCVQRSILAPWVRIHSWALVQDSILFESVRVGRHAKIRKAVIEEGVQIPENAEIGYDAALDRERFMVTKGGIVVVSQGAKIAGKQAAQATTSPSFLKGQPVSFKSCSDPLEPE
jgi:glucose-1-phosphate adenylyltransferase